MSDQKGVSSEEQGIIVPDRLASPHPLIKEARQAFKDAKPNGDGILILRSDQAVLDIRTSDESLSRALRFTDTFLKEIERRGHRVAAPAGKGESATLFVHDETIGFKVDEKQKRVSFA